MQFIEESISQTIKISQICFIELSYPNFDSKKRLKVYRFQGLFNMRTFYFFALLYVLLTEANCTYTNPVSGVGPFYTEQLTINNDIPFSQSLTLNFTKTYNGWTFTSNASPIPNECVVLAIQSLDVTADNGYLTFGISSQLVSRSHINLTINFCQADPTCFRTVTYRMLAIDYYFLQGGITPYDEVKNSIFVTIINVVGVDSYGYNYTPIFNTTEVGWSLYYTPYIRGFRLQGPSTFSIITQNGSLVYYLQQASVHFQFSFTFQSNVSNCQAEFQMLLINPFTLSSNGRFELPITLVDSRLTDTSQISFVGSPTDFQYLSGENLMLGIIDFRLQTVTQLQLNTTVSSTRNYSTDSSVIYGSSPSDSILIQFFILQKIICFSPTTYYIKDINLCSDICPYYIENVVICATCAYLPTCLTCNSSICITCDANTRNLTIDGKCLPLLGYYENNLTIAAPCCGNCSICTGDIGCNVCFGERFYWSPDNQCLFCEEIYSNCANCSENTTVQYGVQCVACQIEHILIINSTYQKCSKQCGDSAIQRNQSCDDGNLINQDGCSNLCEIQQNFTCLQVKNKLYPDFNTSHCIYTSPIEISQTYLQKMPSQNKVELRFNFYPKLVVFQTLNFAQTIQNSIEILWNGYLNQTLTAYKISNGLQQNGLFGVSFQYNQQWNKVQAIFIPQNTGLCVFTQNCNSTRFLQQQSRDQIQQQRKNIKNRKLQTSPTISTPSTTITLSQKSSNNLEMFSTSYFLYSLSQYITYFLIGIVWIYWFIGLLYGKIVVIDFIIILQLISLCSMTVGILNPGFSGMMPYNFVFLCFTDLFKPTYQERPIYENIDLQFKSANISYHGMINLNLMIFLALLIVVVGIIVKICEKVKKKVPQKRQIFQTIFKYCFGQFLFYVMMPFSLNGSLSTILQIKTSIKGGVKLQMIDVLSLIIFNGLAIFFTVLFILGSKNLGQFRSQFLTFDISQHFYFFTMIYTIVLGFIFGIQAGTTVLKYFNLFPIIILVCIFLFVIFKMPYLQKRHMIRITINNGIGVVLIALILIQNIVESKKLKTNLASVIVVFQLLLAIVTGYFLYKSIKVEGISKFHSFQVLLHERRHEKCQISAMSDQSQKRARKIQIEDNDLFDKHNKMLKTIKICTSPLGISVNLKEAYQGIQSDALYDEIQNQNQKNKQQSHQESKNTIISMLKNSKIMKMSLRQHLLDKNSSESQENQVIKLNEELQKYGMIPSQKESESPKAEKLQEQEEKQQKQQNQSQNVEKTIRDMHEVSVIMKKIEEQDKLKMVQQKQQVIQQQQQQQEFNNNNILMKIQQIVSESFSYKEEIEKLKILQQKKIQQQQQYLPVPFKKNLLMKIQQQNDSEYYSSTKEKNRLLKKVQDISEQQQQYNQNQLMKIQQINSEQYHSN